MKTRTHGGAVRVSMDHCATSLTRSSGYDRQPTRSCDGRRLSSPRPAAPSHTATTPAASVARWYEPSTGTFTMVAETGQPYAYAGDDPVNQSDPSGECISLFNIICPGGGPVTSTLSLRFDPGAVPQSVQNFGNGFEGLSPAGTLRPTSTGSGSTPSGRG